jgi:hypothetical protein
MLSKLQPRCARRACDVRRWVTCNRLRRQDVRFRWLDFGWWVVFGGLAWYLKRVSGQDPVRRFDVIETSQCVIAHVVLVRDATQCFTSTNNMCDRTVRGVR